MAEIVYFWPKMAKIHQIDGFMQIKHLKKPVAKKLYILAKCAN